jgi:hypothetical protein
MVFKVGDDYRENPLSVKPGGYTVYVKRTDGKILEYDKIKFPDKFIAKVKKENPDFHAWWE